MSMIQRYHLVSIDHKTWNEHWPNARQAPLLQSWEYGEAKSRTQHFRTQRFLLQNERLGAVGLLQALVYSLPVIGGVARINRGPVFLSDFLHISPSREYARGIMTAIRETAKRQRWHILRIAPNLLNNEELVPIFTALGFKKQDKLPVSSAVVGLSRTPEQIRAGFHGKWRNLLTKSEKMDLELEIPSLASALPFLINVYEKMQREKNFKGLPTRLIKAIADQQGGHTWNCRILCARHRGVRHGAVMVVGHGDTCTYMIGWTSDDGRSLQANYFLLWRAILLFRDLGYSFFDVGGLGANTAAGVGHFKRGLKGEEYSLLGEFSYSVIPFLY
jgi:lipid II:glycine glycyltransferase (peptidoglycan interpeptide bridge formation enzyme)